MPSTLYRQARALLAKRSSVDADALSEFETWLNQSLEVASPWSATGEPLAKNLHIEAHLCGDMPYGDPDELTDFLQHCAVSFRSSLNEDDRVRMFVETCRLFARKGVRISTDYLPIFLTRIICHDKLKLVEIALERMVGLVHATQFRNGQISILEAAKMLADNWDASGFEDDDKLGRDLMVFASPTRGSFGSGMGPLEVAQSLGLPCAFGDGLPRTRHVLQCDYHTVAVVNHRFPTIADASRFPGFGPAPETPPLKADQASCSGWTRPLGSMKQQPEIVHDNASLMILRSPLAYLGSFWK
jgi:hypothetical protein